MKRGFLFGLGSGLALEAVWSLVYVLPLATLYGDGRELEGYLRVRMIALGLSVAFVAMSYGVIRWAYSFPPQHSWVNMGLGWFAGFLPCVIVIAREVLGFVVALSQ